MNEQTVYKRRWWILGALCLSLLVIGLDNTILNVALPTLVRSLHASETQLQWMVDSYTLLFAALLLTMGSLGDRFGRRSALAAGLTVFASASALSAFATSPTMLILARALMGIGAAAIMPSTLSILTNVFPEAERGKAIGIWAGVSAIGIALGPLLGGWLLEHFWWGSVFLINVPVAIVALVAGHVIIPDSRDPEARRLDPVGAVLSAVGLLSLVYAVIEVPTKGWAAGDIVIAFSLGTAVLVAFAAWELRSDHPMLNLNFFRNPSFWVANVSVTLAFFALSSMLFFLSQYLQFVLGYSPLQTGVRLLPMVLTMLVMAPIAGKLVERMGNKLLVAGGFLIAAGGAYFLSTTSNDSQYGHMVLGLVIIATGVYMAIVPATNSIMGSLPHARAGVGSAMNDTTRQVGGTLGVAILGSILTGAYRSSIAPSVRGLSPGALAASKSSIGGAIAVGHSVGGSAGASIILAAKSAFIDGIDRGFEVAAVFLLVSAIVALLWLPNRVIGPEEASAEDSEMEVGVATRRWSARGVA